MNNKFEVTIWGCRGSSPVNALEMMKYGCNTPCVSVRCGDNLLVLDGGTGIINFEKEMYQKLEKKPDLHILITHYHFDHIEGIPFLKAPFDGKTNLHFYGKGYGGETCGDLISRVFSPPYFPLYFVSGERANRMHFHSLDGYESYELYDGVVIDTAPLNHPGGSYAFKVTYNGKSFCYVTDYEYDVNTFGPVKAFIYGCDLLILDTCFSESSYLKGWGHSTWEKGVEIALEQNVGSLLLYHHNIDFNDIMLDEINRKINAISSGFHVSKERMSVLL